MNSYWLKHVTTRSHQGVRIWHWNFLTNTVLHKPKIETNNRPFISLRRPWLLRTAKTALNLVPSRTLPFAPRNSRHWDPSKNAKNLGALFRKHRHWELWWWKRSLRRRVGECHGFGFWCLSWLSLLLWLCRLKLLPEFLCLEPLIELVSVPG